MNTENKPEEIEEIVNVSDFPNLPRMYRWRFGSDSRRVYFRKGFPDFYSGITTAIAGSGLVTKEYINKYKVEQALNGVDIQPEWDIKMNYGTLFHLLLSMHERNDATHQPFVFTEHSDEGQVWRQMVKEYATNWGTSYMYDTWVSQLQNDFAAWYKFKQERDWVTIASEVCVFDDNSLIATPLDVIGYCTFNSKTIVANINVKTGSSISGKDYTLQVAMESWLYNNQIGKSKYNIQSAFLWCPKNRDSSPNDYSLSKDLLKAHNEDEFRHIANGVRLNGLNRPKSNLVTYEGTEKDFKITTQSPYQWLEQFNTQ